MTRRTECILTFHGVGEPPHELSPGEARVWLAEKRFLSILDALQGCTGVRITFDDGNASDIRIAAPALSIRGLRATFFLCSDRLDKPGYITGNEAMHLTSMGHTIGSHGAAHRPWRNLNAESVETEIVYARARLEDAVGGAVNEAACPFGAYDRRTLRALRDAGFARVYTSDGGHVEVGSWLAARSTIRSVDNALSVEKIVKNASASPMRALKRWIKTHR